jgi:hypothetical protein
MTDSWHSYPSIYALGHRAIVDLLKGPVYIEEKIDGSQFSFGFFNGEIRCRSKGAVLNIDAPENMFAGAVAWVKNNALNLRDGWTYRGEVLSKPKHNVLCYSRIPEGGIIVFDINNGHESYLTPVEKKYEAERIGLECVPLLHWGRCESVDELNKLLETESVLGGTLIEGVVIKPAAYDLFGRDKKVLMGKFVSEKFKEKHSREWKSSNPTGKDIIGLLGESLTTPARWQKAVQHLREAGQIDDSPRDIGKLLIEIKADIGKEETEFIAERLVKWAMPHILRSVVRGFPEWYKEQLAQKQFEGQEE